VYEVCPDIRLATPPPILRPTRQSEFRADPSMTNDLASPINRCG